MAEKKSFLLRLDARTFAALKRWADDDLRSVNGQVEFLLRRALDQAGRLRPSGTDPASPEDPRASSPEESDSGV